VDVDDDDLLAEQRSYYQARAPEYDEWWQRRGRFDRGEEKLREWQRQVAVVDDALTSFGANGSFWLSHVPRARFGEFWSLVGSCLTRSGRAFLIANRDDPAPDTTAKDPFVLQYETDLHLRRLRDGTRYRVVNVMYEPGELESLIEAEGWTTEIRATSWFIFGSAGRL
jgi:hypothetical protein